MTSEIKTPLTMSNDEFLVLMIEKITGITLALAEVLDRVEDLLGPPPRPDLSLVSPQEEDDDG
jgi:hypothetical protein